MTDFSYTLGIPNGPNDPSNDQPNMKINNDNISAIIGVDHVTFNQNNGGYHTDIHQIPLGGDPGAMSGIGQIYSKTLGSDQSLFYESGAGIITQLTGTNSSAFLQNTNGYIWIAGTILLQWGRKVSLEVEQLNRMLLLIILRKVILTCQIIHLLLWLL